VCGGMHFLRRTDRPVHAARQCDECRTRHPAKQNEVWFESSSAGGWVGEWAGGVWGVCGPASVVSDAILRLGVWFGGCVALRFHGRLPSRQELNCLPACGSAPAPARCLPAGFRRRQIHMFCCYKGVVYDMR
jgi:hypothetical protein